jgi:hypothetical protein
MPRICNKAYSANDVQCNYCDLVYDHFKLTNILYKLHRLISQKSFKEYAYLTNKVVLLWSIVHSVCKLKNKIIENKHIYI